MLPGEGYINLYVLLNGERNKAIYLSLISTT